jgi:DNA-binding CsgD family transcriptional regulator
VLERSEARLEHAHALVALGSGLIERGERAAAREPLTCGLDLAYRGGGGAIAERARAQLLTLGLRPRRQALSGPEALTPAERRTARMAAGGLSNRQIAQALFVSPKTVESQLSRAYEKLGIRTRAELAAALGG